MPKPCPVSIGEKWGRLTILKFVGVKNRKRLFGCRCDCGRIRVASGQNLARGVTRSCGCLAIEEFVLRSRKHGMTNTPTWTSWQAMVKRCHSETSVDYYLYGARGIRVCERWRGSFENFLADMGERPEGMTLDRADSNAGYSPENCRWASRATQARNQRRAKLNETLAAEIRVRHERGESTMRIAKSLGVSSATVGDVCAGRTWRPNTAAKPAPGWRES